MKNLKDMKKYKISDNFSYMLSMVQIKMGSTSTFYDSIKNWWR